MPFSWQAAEIPDTRSETNASEKRFREKRCHKVLRPRQFLAFGARRAAPDGSVPRCACTHEVVGDHGHHEVSIGFLDAVHHHLTNRANVFAQADPLFNEPALLLRDSATLAGSHFIGHA